MPLFTYRAKSFFYSFLFLNCPFILYKSLDRLGFHNADINVIRHFNFIISREQSLIDQVTFENSTKEVLKIEGILVEQTCLSHITTNVYQQNCKCAE